MSVIGFGVKWSFKLVVALLATFAWAFAILWANGQGIYLTYVFALPLLALAVIAPPLLYWRVSKAMTVFASLFVTLGFGLYIWSWYGLPLP